MGPNLIMFLARQGHSILHKANLTPYLSVGGSERAVLQSAPAHRSA